MRRMNKILFGLIFIMLSITSLNAQNSLLNSIKSIKEKVVEIICYDLDSKGTGFVIDKNGFIVTCNHVVAKYNIANNQLTSISYSDSIYAILKVVRKKD